MATHIARDVLRTWDPCVGMPRSRGIECLLGSATFNRRSANGRPNLEARELRLLKLLARARA